MKITYDAEIDALSIRFRETTVTSREHPEGIAFEYDADGHLAGIEIFDASKRLGTPDGFRQVTLEGLGVATGGQRR